MKKLPLLAALLASACAFQPVQFTSDPPKARIYVDGSDRGEEPVTASLSVDSFANMLGKRHDIVAKLDGYEDETLTLENFAGFFTNTHPFPNSVHMKLKPKAGMAAAIASGKNFPVKPAVDAFKKGSPRPDDVAVIIGNADYKAAKDVPDVMPAYADAAGFKLYAETALGISPGNVIFLKDATSAQLARVFGSDSNPKGQLYDWTKPNSRVFVYYAGHGAPATNGGSYLVPADADSGRIELNGYPVATLFANLGKLPAESVTVVLEACFSGNSQAGGLVRNASPLITTVKSADVPAKVTVFTAGSPNQIASWEETKAHSLFSANYLKGAAGEADASPYGNGDGQVDAPELQRYLKDKVTYAARRAYGRDQTPELRVGN